MDEAKYLDPQLLDDEPGQEWSLGRLEAAAAETYAALLADELSHTALYWLLGQLLSLIRKQLKHGQWGPWLKAQRIDKTRAAKATRIFQGFAAVEELQGLTVAEAYERCQRRPRAKSIVHNTASETKLVASEAERGANCSWGQQLLEQCHLAEHALEKLDELTAAEAESAAAEVERAITLLKKLQRGLRRRCQATTRAPA